MTQWMTVAMLTFGAGLAMPLGAGVACIERIRPDWLDNEFRHSVIAFGGGALLSAVALVLVPEGMADLSGGLVAMSFVIGGATFLGIDLTLNKFKTSASQLLAMLADFLPEAIALGATFASPHSAGPLLALLIGLQNFPEGFNAYRELTHSGKLTRQRVLWAFTAMALLGPLAGLSGYFLLAPYPAAVSCLMLFAAGGILYLTFQDIAPQARLRHHWAPPMGAVAGFLLGMLGQLLIPHA